MNLVGWKIPGSHWGEFGQNHHDGVSPMIQEYQRKKHINIYTVLYIYISYMYLIEGIFPQTLFEKTTSPWSRWLIPCWFYCFSLLILGIFWSGGDIRSITSLPKTPWMQLGDRIWTNQTVDASGSPAEKKHPEDERYPGTCPVWRFGRWSFSFLFMWDGCRFQPLIFQGRVTTWDV